MVEQTLTGRVMDGIRGHIAARRLCVGDRLPSVRQSAASFGVCRNRGGGL